MWSVITNRELKQEASDGEEDKLHDPMIQGMGASEDILDVGETHRDSFAERGVDAEREEITRRVVYGLHGKCTRN